MSVRAHPFLLVGSAFVVACAGDSGRLTYEEAGQRFEANGVQPGQRLPPLSLVTLEGAALDLVTLQGERPLVIVTCSLTCNVARRQQIEANALRQRFGDRIAMLMVYTIDAHPKGDPCPYTGAEWVPRDNERDAVLVPQPTSIEERLALAQRYAADWAQGTQVAVDTLDDASWRALGEAPNVGLVVGKDGVVVERTGWFDSAQVAAALDRLLQ